MKYALVCGQKVEATKGAIGHCPSCGAEMIARCGEKKINHWAHKGIRNCDPWWENETEWHRSWKGHFPQDWQEIIHKSESGEKHIADVKTETGWAIEFQHSYLNPDERRARNAFYPKLVWVVDGMRRQRDIQQFQKALKEGRVLNREPLIIRIDFPAECRLIKEWMDSSALVLFDFHDDKTSNDSVLWILLPRISNSETYLMSISRGNFIQYQLDDRFEKLFTDQILSYRDQLIELKKMPNVRRRPRYPLSNAQRRRRSRRF